MSKHIMMNNEMLMFGTGILIIGAVLASYSFSTYVEMQKLYNRIDFETVDKNNQISTTEKYYRYMEYSDFLNDKLKKNRRIPMKRIACVYLDYAQHNTVEMYYLTKDKMPFDKGKTKIATDNIKNLLAMLNSYKSCKQSSSYKVILEGLLRDAENADKKRIEAEERLEEFLYGNEAKLPLNLQEQPEVEIPEIDTSIRQNVPIPNYIDSEGRAQTLTPEQIEYINEQQEKHLQSPVSEN